jgi:hypothetical protein
MITIPRLRIGLAAVVVCATAALAQSNHGGIQYPTLPANVRTYAFRAVEPNKDIAEKDMQCETPLLQGQTNTAIASQLDARGMRRNDEHPDVYVVTHRWFVRRFVAYGPYDATWEPYDQPLYQGLRTPCRSAWVGYQGFHGYNGGVYADLYASLRVDLVDAATGAVLWQGTETRRIPHNPRQDKQATRQVAEVFEHFPVAGAAVAAGN